MASELDLDDVAATSPLAKQELDALRAEVERLRRLRQWDERPDTLPGGLVLEHARLDGMWRTLVEERMDFMLGKRAAEAELERLKKFTICGCDGQCEHAARADAAEAKLAKAREIATELQEDDADYQLYPHQQRIWEDLIIALDVPRRKGHKEVKR
jgi:hypothetical protein